MRPRQRESQPAYHFNAPRSDPVAFWWWMTTVTCASFTPMRWRVPTTMLTPSMTAQLPGRRFTSTTTNPSIIEYNLPRLTGVELVMKLRSARMALPVILVTGQLPAEVLVQNPLLQLTALLPKPFYLSQLLETVRAVLQATGSIPGLEPPPVWPGQSSAAGLRL